MNRYVADTHALFWHLTGSDKIGAAAGEAFAEAERGDAVVYLPAIVLAELYYMNRKLRSPLDFGDTFRQIAQTAHFCLVPLVPQDVADFVALPTGLEMHDRMIAQAALRLGAVLLTRDVDLVQCQAIQTKW